MKIKGKVKALNVSALLPIFIVSTLSSILVRSMQVYNLIDASTGFYKQSSLVNIVFYVLIFGTGLVFIVFSFLSSQSMKLEVSGIKSKPLAFVTYAYAVLLVFDTVKNFLSGLSSYNDFSGFEESKFKFMMSNGTIPMLIQSIFGLFSIIYFFCLAFSFKNGNRKVANRKLMALAPVGWVAFRMIYLFVSKISFIRVSDLFLELIMFACMAIFFMALAQVASGVYSDGTSWKLTGFGLSAALIAASLEVSRLIFTIIDRVKYINPNHPFNIIDLMFCIFVPILVFTMCRHANKRTTVSENDIDANSSEKRNPDADVL
ncbi:MAG: hypothetical protein NC122_01345 [Faecalibacterium sp.]|nr:hypothetical protein [Ruminococcus sp.]MCM1392027.1 hypothetical protein [Ruminococcus sp.]MCM1484834.1 hypothetical protein [Faecalibacterium sp.]